MPVKVKICGITRLEDAAVAVEAGADAVGFVFYEQSPRAISIPAAASIISELPPYIVKTGVFVDAPEETVLGAIGQCGLTLLQFHGNESPEYCLGFGLMAMKAFRIKGEETLEQLPGYATHAWLLDAYTPGKAGGTGDRFDWKLAAQARRWGRPIFLAGGLTPENVAQAIQEAQPYGVDVSSGVEKAPGQKDADKVRDFVRNAKAA